MSAFGAAGGSISGTVYDPMQSAVVNAKVTVINENTNIRLSFQTNANGYYSFPELAVGAYDVEVEAPGFRLYRQTNLTLDANSALRVDVNLVLGNREDSVTVAALQAHVETADTQLVR